MAEENLVAFLEEWQTGAFLVLGSALVGAVLASVFGSFGFAHSALIGFVGGAALAFLALSYLLYGR